ncbi:hydroxymethylglutaryl-CoA reductase, degradative [Vagococcus silagei]|uniref:3-hydroxy-3-methylglutaryl coenzyme A reductase n=2 Tax=Vagococcus silagei TaxID=2508885 RepID=A0A4S3B1X5_9ENTE|nr:hydroxymethylglutaryl-CoA reductase, degradative [Vagococcus silagei]
MILKEQHLMDDTELAYFENNTQMTPEVADALIENQITQFTLPEGLALNFKINQRDCIIPMVTEEPSVIAAASHAAKVFSEEGFTSKTNIIGMIGQIILPDVCQPEEIIDKLKANEETIKQTAALAHPSIVKRGGGLQNIDYRTISDSETGMVFVTLHLIIDTKDAMGANIVNTILEGVKPLIESLTMMTPLMSILSNFNTTSCVTATCQVKIEKLPNKSAFSNLELAERIVAADRYAKLDPYRAATHNKGIMNGIDAVIIATGNDPRAVEAGIHAYASRNGQYQGLTSWTIKDDMLKGEITLPLALGTVGGAISVLPHAKANLNLMQVTHADELAEIIAAVGLAQNFAALKALVSEGIQKGHMSLHASSLAIQVGAVGEEIERLTEQLKTAEKMNRQVALEMLARIRKS